jgi:hypothetical protein
MIAPEYRRFYTVAAGWPATRRPILDRAQWCCERCGVPHRAYIWRGPNGVWIDQTSGVFIEPGELLVDLRPPIERGVVVENDPDPRDGHLARVKIGVAHRNHNPADNRHENLAAWCGWCHLDHDQQRHRETRCTNKDRRRPLFEALWMEQR